MFIGHFGLGLASKKISPQTSLGTSLMAAQFIDLLWPFFLLAGIEQVEIAPGDTAFTPLNFISYPFSHSLAAVAIWGLLFGLVYFFITKNKKGAVVMGMLVVSHWLLDWLTHRPDLPLGFGEESKAGLGLWHNVSLTIMVEMLLFGAGVYLYARATRAKNKWGQISLWSFVLMLVVIYFMNVFGPPPPSAEMISYVGLAQWLFIAWGYWIDSQRTAFT